MKKLLILLPLLFAFALSLGCHRWSSPEGRVDFVKDRIAGELDLNRDQEAKLDDLANTIKDQIKLVKEQRRQDTHQEEVKALMAAPVLDGDKARALFEKKKGDMSSRAESIYAAVYPKLAVFHDSLNDEQRQKAVELMDKHHKRWDKN